MNTIILKEKLKNELGNRLLPFWSSYKDELNGGFFGFADFEGNIDQTSSKACILNSRLLWFFAAAYGMTGKKQARECADHAYRFLTKCFLDRTDGGLFWSVAHDGKPDDDRKHVYVQSFGIYALAQYYLSCGEKEALKLAMRLFSLVEEKCRDEDGYQEEFSRRWELKSNDMLSEHGVLSSRTMNTNLHLLEAYTALYQATHDIRVGERLTYLIETVETKIYDESRKALKVFFDNDWNETLDIRSYGHDIEASWLIDRATEALGQDHPPLTRSIAEEIYKSAYSPDGVINETVKGTTDQHRVWWVQAESVVGFFNAYLKTGNPRYADAAVNLWAYIQNHFLDHMTGEWYSELDETGRVLHIPVVSAWKCPYHNGRMCMETIHLLSDLEKSPFEARYLNELYRHCTCLARKNYESTYYNGIYSRFENPALTRDHIPLTWRYDLNRTRNPFFQERLGVNAVFNPGAIEYDGKFYLMARIEGSDRKSFFGIAESPNGIDRFRFRPYPVLLPENEEEETNVYDIRLTRHEDGWIYGVYCSEHRDPDAPEGDLSSAIANAAIIRTHDLATWERLPNLKTPSPQQRNVVLHPEFVNGKYAFYTRPMDNFIETGSGSGICIGYCPDIRNPVIKKETILSKRKYHTITESKNGEGCVPIKTPKGWIHIAHGVRNTAAGLRYVIYLYITALDNIEKVIAEPSGYLIAPLGRERAGDVSNVVFSNGAIARDNGDVYIYYASSDTRIHVATTTVDRLLDYAFHVPADPLNSSDCVRQRNALIRNNLIEMGWQ